MQLDCTGPSDLNASHPACHLRLGFLVIGGSYFPISMPNGGSAPLGPTVQIGARGLARDLWFSLKMLRNLAEPF